MNSVHAKVSEAGRISLPAAFRKAVGLDRGGDVVVELDGSVIRIRSLKEVIGEAQAIARRIMGNNDPEGSVDAFIAERRREAAKEDAEADGKEEEG
ncbi:MAG TPA: AbrB/MazE/SpoVT family DNA-binding domain-containing protein [Stellaceae bacterium]